KYESLYSILRTKLNERLLGLKAGEKGTGKDPRPQLAYEMLAHLVKHGFVDDVVSFNFDQLMERALYNELGERNYHLLVSDLQLSSSGSAGGRRRPRLLKVHGSIDMPKSLRFTPQST